MKRKRDGAGFRAWPEPLPRERQTELAREMAHLRSRVRYLRLWKLAACRTQDLLSWRRYDELQREAQRAYERVRNVLWESNMSLVCWVAQKCLRDPLTVDDLVELGTFKLLVALDSYDPHRGFALSTYLTVALRREFWHAIQKERARRARQTVLRDERDLEELAGYYYEDAGQDPAGPLDIQQALAHLDDRERDIVLARAGRERETLAEAGRRHGISKERARQVEWSALTKLAGRLGAGEVVSGLGRV
jgi:RNA polymerase sigma factor (sigma-70 family)